MPLSLAEYPVASPAEETWCREEYVSSKDCAKWIADAKVGNPLWGLSVTPDEAALCKKEYVELYQCKIWVVNRQKSKKAQENRNAAIAWSAAANFSAMPLSLAEYPV